MYKCLCYFSSSFYTDSTRKNHAEISYTRVGDGAVMKLKHVEVIISRRYLIRLYVGLTVLHITSEV